MNRSFEKRKRDRVKVERFIIKYRIKDSDSSPVTADVLNISSDGLCFVRNTAIDKGTEIDILFPFKTKKTILNAEVIRIEGREVAVKFISAPEIIDEFSNAFNSEYKIIKDELIKKEKNKNNMFSKSKHNYSENQRKADDDSMFDL